MRDRSVRKDSMTEVKVYTGNVKDGSTKTLQEREHVLRRVFELTMKCELDLLQHSAGWSFPSKGKNVHRCLEVRKLKDVQ